MKRIIRQAVLLTLMSVINKPALQVQQVMTMVRETRYLVCIPEGYDDNLTQQWPLVVFLHGAGERGSDIEKVKVHGPPKLVEMGEKFPFILVSPQCPEGEWWSAGVVIDLVRKISSTYRVDPSRIYLTGLSMGGFATWESAARYPGVFAAIAPICGGGDPAMVHSLVNVPVWNFHGAKDPVVPIQRSEDMVNALKEAGGDVRFTVYPEAGHDSWTETYNNPELYKWLLGNVKEDKRGPTVNN
ncbi:MAG: prolyl oligopeptidase family serine peptidase [Bacteroidales bacterium]